MMRVSDLMTTAVATLGPDDPVSMARDIMAGRRIRHLPVVDAQGVFLGLVSHRDILAASMSRLDVDAETQRQADAATPVSRIMSADVLTAAPQLSVRQAATDMLEAKVGCLPVLESGRLVGILTESDYLKLVVELLDALDPTQ